MVHDTFLLNTQYYKVHIKCKVEQSKERSSTFPYTSVANLDMYKQDLASNNLEWLICHKIQPN